MVSVTITSPTLWHEQCQWIRNNCVEYIDITNWGLWQIGMDSIYFLLLEEDAILFKLAWK